jgi:hypothetical protein
MSLEIAATLAYGVFESSEEKKNDVLHQKWDDLGTYVEENKSALSSSQDENTEIIDVYVAVSCRSIEERDYPKNITLFENPQQYDQQIAELLEKFCIEPRKANWYLSVSLL